MVNKIGGVINENKKEPSGQGGIILVRRKYEFLWNTT